MCVCERKRKKKKEIIIQFFIKFIPSVGDKINGKISCPIN